MRLLKIGRDNSCDIVLHSEKVSSLHAEITLLNSGDIQLEDKGSRNGTFVMNQQIKPGKLVSVRRGDAIRFADVELQWSQVPLPEDNSLYKALWGVGTNFNNEIQVSGATVSRYHATIKAGKDGKMYIFDHSKNGTTVDGVRIPANTAYRIKKSSAVVCGGVAVDLSRLPWPKNSLVIVGSVAAAILVLLVVGFGIWKIIPGKKTNQETVTKVVRKASYTDEELYKKYASSIVFLQGVYHFRVNGVPVDVLKRFKLPVDFYLNSEGSIVDIENVSSQTFVSECSYSATGFFISKDGKIITNLHVVKDWLFQRTNVTDNTGNAKTLQQLAEESFKKEFARRLGCLNVATSGVYEALQGDAAYIAQIKIEGILDRLLLIPQAKYFSAENATECRVLSAGNNIDIDVALVQSEKGELPSGSTYIDLNQAMDTSDEALAVGSHVYTIGFPAGNVLQDKKSEKGLQVVARGGSITQANTDYRFGFDAPSWGGASGSPIFNSKGKLIGVLNSGLGENFTFGIKARYVKEIVENPHRIE